MNTIKTLEINNFKSIKQLKLDCKRINILIGEPNTGKSNILESLGLFSYCQYYYYSELKDYVRFERVTNLFRDELVDTPIDIKTDLCSLRVEFKKGQFIGTLANLGNPVAMLQGNYSNFSLVQRISPPDSPPFIKSYKFKLQTEFVRSEADFLLPPYGANLLTMLLTNRDLKATASDIFARYGLRLVLKPQENKIEVIKLLEDVIVSYPYSLTSDTLQRIIFHLFAILSNRDSILVFEEPESHAFPYYTKYFAESIALDKEDRRNNQYFISTHNPYLLLPLLEKAPQEDIAVFITYFDDYQTKIKALNVDQMKEIMELDIFSNLDRFLEKA